MATTAAPAPPKYTDTVEFIGKPDYFYRVKRTFEGEAHKEITVTISPAQLPRYTGSFAWRTTVEIVLGVVRPTLDSLTALEI